MKQEKLSKIITLHKKWLNLEDDGVRADLKAIDLRYADLRHADLRHANLRYADLRYADLRRANLRFANLSSANLSSADLSSANLSSANLSSADLKYANLISAKLNKTDLNSTDLRYVISNSDRIHTLQVPPHQITILDKEIVFGGCTEKTAKEWLAYSDDSLSEKDKHYLETVTKPFIRMVLAM